MTKNTSEQRRLAAFAELRALEQHPTASEQIALLHPRERRRVVGNITLPDGTIELLFQPRG